MKLGAVALLHHQCKGSTGLCWILCLVLCTTMCWRRLRRGPSGSAPLHQFPPNATSSKSNTEQYPVASLVTNTNSDEDNKNGLCKGYNCDFDVMLRTTKIFLSLVQSTLLAEKKSSTCTCGLTNQAVSIKTAHCLVTERHAEYKKSRGLKMQEGQ